MVPRRQQKRLLDRSQPLAKRMRVVCSLRAVAGQGTVEALASCLDDESALLRHEVAYALGQKEEASAVGVLIKALKEDQDSMVRHEAAEALGAINVAEAEKVLEEFENCDCEPLAHTCQLALDRIRWSRSKKDAASNGQGAYLHVIRSRIHSLAHAPASLCTNPPSLLPIDCECGCGRTAKGSMITRNFCRIENEPGCRDAQHPLTSLSLSLSLSLSASEPTLYSLLPAPSRRA